MLGLGFRIGAVASAFAMLRPTIAKAMRMIGPVGINIGGDQFGGALPCQFLDHSKASSPWDAGNSGTLTVTPFGYPATVTTYAECTVPVDGLMAKPGIQQRYVLKTTKTDWTIGIEGAGANGGAPVSDTTLAGVRRIVFDVNDAHLESNGSVLRFYVFAIPTPFVDGTDTWQICRLDQEATLDSGRIFGDEIITSTKTYGCVREMDIGNALSSHNGAISQFSQLTPLGKAVWNTGLPLEAQVALANEADVPLWYNTPYGMSDAMATEVFTYIDQHLAPHLPCLPEYSDELWNSNPGFYPGFAFASSICNPPIVGADNHAASGAGYRSAQIMALAHKASGYSNRFRPFFGSQGNQINVARDTVTGIRAKIAEWSDPTSSNHDPEFAARFKEVGQLYKYFGGGFYLEILTDNLSAAGKAEVLTWANDPDGGVAKIIQQMWHGNLLTGNLLNNPNDVQLCVDTIGSLYADQITLAHELQVEIAGYEGSPCFTQIFDPVFQGMTTKAIHAPAFQPLTQAWLTAFFTDARYSVLMCFTDIGTGEDTWGALDSPYDLTTPRYLGYKAIQQNPPAAPPLTVSVTTLGQTKVGLNPTDRLTITGGRGEKTITITGLRPDRSFDGFRSITGTIMTPTPAPATATITVTDGAGNSATCTFVQNFQPASAPTIGVTLFGGQSIMTRMFRIDGDTTTMASIGVVPSPDTQVFATYSDPGAADNYTPPVDQIVWQTPSDHGQYKSAGVATFLNLKRAFSGRPWRAVGAPVGSTPISSWAVGSANLNNLLAVLAQSGGRADEVVWMIGHTDAANGTSYADFRAGLDATLGAIKKASSVVPTFYVGSIGFLSGSYGTDDQILTIRRAAHDWCVDNGAVYVEPQDNSTVDRIHPDQRGAIIEGTHWARATRPTHGLPGDDTGPSLSSVTRANGKLDLNFTLPTGASNIVVTGYALANRLRVYPAGTTVNPITVDWQNAVVSGATISLTDPAPSQAVDVYLEYACTGVDYTDGAANAIRDDHIEADEAALGITFGRSDRPTLAPVSAAAVAAAQTPTPTPTPATTGYRYMRVTPTASIAGPLTSSSIYGSNEYIPHLTDGTAVPIVGAVVSDGSTVAAGNDLAHLYDGNTGSPGFGVYPGAGQTISDLGASGARPASLDVYAYSDASGYSFASGTVELSNDQTTWVQVFSGAAPGYNNGFTTLPFTYPNGA